MTWQEGGKRPKPGRRRRKRRKLTLRPQQYTFWDLQIPTVFTVFTDVPSWGGR